MICVKRDYEREGAKVIIKGDERDLAIEFNALLIQLEESPDLLRLFTKVSNIRMEKLKELHKNDQNNISNEGWKQDH